MTGHFFREYCLECDCVHWVEVLPIMKRTQICHGRDYFPKNDAQHYTRWRAGGIEIVEKAPRAVSLDFQFLEELANQEW